MLYKMSMLAALTAFASAVPVPVTVPDVPLPVHGAAASRTINVATKPLSDKRKLLPTDAAYVQKSLIPSDMSSKIQDYCQNTVCNGEGTEWHMLGDPIENFTPDPTWVQAHPDQMTWSGLDNPTATEYEQQVDCDNTGNSEAMTCHATISVEHGTTMTTSTSVASKIGVEFGVEVGIPEVMKVSGKTSFDVTTTDTSSKAVSQSETITISVDVPVAAGERKCFYVSQKVSKFDSTWTLPMSITDGSGRGIRCEYSSPCNDHYYWFSSVRGMSAADTSYTVSGKATAKVMSYGAIKTRDGACNSPSAGKGQLI